MKDDAWAVGKDSRPVLITGGAGFIGTNLADCLCAGGTPVTIYDNLSRAGAERNLEWLRQRHGTLLRAEVADVRDAPRLAAAVRASRAVYHLAAQVAVTTSVRDPRLDFEVNVGGMLNLLEALRSCSRPPPLVFTSTNKVYGNLADVPVERVGRRYEPVNALLRRTGISETQPLDFHSPYGCSKGAADQYALDHARTYGLPVAVFRISCVYGRHQLGTEDQGWVAHFLIRALAGAPITVYGDGYQVRDILFVDDLVEALQLAQARMAEVQGQAFNIGGGPERTVSLLELVSLLERLQGQRIAIERADWRVGDQRYFVSDTNRFRSLTGWAPKYSAARGVAELFGWFRGQAAATEDGTGVRFNGRGSGPGAGSPVEAPAVGGVAE